MPKYNKTYGVPGLPGPARIIFSPGPHDKLYPLHKVIIITISLCPRLGNHALKREIMRLFKQDLSADQISGRLGALYPDRREKQVSPSTINTCLYRETAKDPEMKGHFRQKQAKPRYRKGVKDRCCQIRGRVSIVKRPQIVEEKSRMGDWEGDTIESAGKNTYIATFVDRKTKLLPAKIMPDKAAIRAFKPIPAQMRNTLTLDKGKEFAAQEPVASSCAGHLFRPSLSLMGTGAQRTHQRADTAVPA